MDPPSRVPGKQERVKPDTLFTFARGIGCIPDPSRQNETWKPTTVIHTSNISCLEHLQNLPPCRRLCYLKKVLYIILSDVNEARPFHFCIGMVGKAAL